MSVAAPPSFSLTVVAHRWRVRRWLAADFVKHFISLGLIEKVGPGEYAVTAAGREWSEGLRELAAELLEIDA